MPSGILSSLKAKLTHHASSDEPAHGLSRSGDSNQEEMALHRPTVAIFGATGNLGARIAQAFLQEDKRKQFSDIILFSRNTASGNAAFEEWEKAGVARISQLSPDVPGLREQLSGVDIVVNAIGTKGDAMRTQLVHAIAGSNVKLYFPSEYGVDHTVHDFSFPEWDKKKANFQLVTELFTETKTCRVFIGLFLEDSIGPWFGFNTKKGNYESYGDANQKVAYTSQADVGRALVALSLLPLDKVPAQVHLCGDLVSMHDIAAIMRNKSGDEIRIVEDNLEQSKKKVLAAPSLDPAECLRFLMGEGKIKHATGFLGCDNELINPGETQWKWKTMLDLANETGGRPWADY